MNRKPHQTDDSLETLESDAVWKLLDQAPLQAASPRFLDDTVRAARLMEAPQPWWKRLFAPAPLAGLAGATAALVFTITQLTGPAPEPEKTAALFESEQAAAIQEIAAAETLIAAVDHLDDFSDHELVSLIGF